MVSTSQLTLLCTGTPPSSAGNQGVLAKVASEKRLQRKSEFSSLSTNAIPLQLITNSFPVFRTIFVTNTLKSELVTFSWLLKDSKTNERGCRLNSGIVVMVSPLSGVLRPGEKKLCKITIKPSAFPCVVDEEIYCKCERQSAGTMQFSARSSYLRRSSMDELPVPESEALRLSQTETMALKLTGHVVHQPKGLVADENIKFAAAEPAKLEQENVKDGARVETAQKSELVLGVLNASIDSLLGQIRKI